jgi:hypothetical protein
MFHGNFSNIWIAQFNLNPKWIWDSSWIHTVFTTTQNPWKRHYSPYIIYFVELPMGIIWKWHKFLDCQIPSLKLKNEKKFTILNMIFNQIEHTNRQSCSSCRKASYIMSNFLIGLHLPIQIIQSLLWTFRTHEES